MKKILDLMKKDIPFMDNFNLPKLYPGYFNKSIFRLIWLLLLVLIIWDLSLNHWNFQTISLSCPENSLNDCRNPFYTCRDSNSSNPFSFNFQELNTLNNCYNGEPPAFICDKGYCDIEYLKPGEHLGRNDLLSKFGELILLLLVPLAFLLNHLNYYFKTGNWKYKKKLGDFNA